MDKMKYKIMLVLYISVFFISYISITDHKYKDTSMEVKYVDNSVTLIYKNDVTLMSGTLDTRDIYESTIDSVSDGMLYFIYSLAITAFVIAVVEFGIDYIVLVMDMLVKLIIKRPPV